MKSEKIISDIEIENIKIDVFHNERHDLSSSYVLFLKTHADLIEKNLRYPVTHWNDKHLEIIYGCVENEPIGFITYYLYSKDPNIAVLDTCYVKEEFRKKGFLKLLLRLLENILQKQEVTYFGAEIPTEDQSIQEIFKSLGFIVVYKRLHKQLEM